MWNEPAFDRHAFSAPQPGVKYASGKRAVSANSQISFQDYSRMHMERRAETQERRLPTPAWAVDDAKLREVVVSYVERRYFITAADSQKPMEERMALIERECARHLPDKESHLDTALRRNRFGAPSDIEVQNLDTQIMLDRRGCVAVVMSVAYLYYRIGWNSVGVAEELQLKSPHVRELLWRLHKVGRWIEAGRPKPWKGWKEKRPPAPWPHMPKSVQDKLNSSKARVVPPPTRPGSDVDWAKGRATDTVWNPTMKQWDLVYPETTRARQHSPGS